MHGCRGRRLPLRCYVIDAFGSCATTACLIGGKLRNFSRMREEAKRSTPYPQNNKSEHQHLVRSAHRNRWRSLESSDPRRWPRAAAGSYSTSASVSACVGRTFAPGSDQCLGLARALPGCVGGSILVTHALLPQAARCIGDMLRACMQCRFLPTHLRYENALDACPDHRWQRKAPPKCRLRDRHRKNSLLVPENRLGEARVTIPIPY
jgi:hypothetical protein